ncbi:beta-2 adrenergic receptor-like [Saccoglossus kowalevskii]|uniref:Octopamine receptor beta-3R-like n=1 Tax=Saccoglossus kowalevskii TaxID=10224 RepID=A0ABM0GQA2_SACKO|nr:PREDICTED: octopamine receptor beta-3R-like [Saccoglossus kowalevskii]
MDSSKHAFICNDTGDDNISGASCQEPPPWSVSMVDLVLGIVFCIITLAAIVGNVFVIVAVFKYRRLRTMTNLFILNLAFADELVGSLIMTTTLSYHFAGKWHFGNFYCHFWLAIDIVGCTSSINHLCCIAIDRYVAINFPFTYDAKMSANKLACISTIVWIMSALIGFIPIFLGWYTRPGFQQPPMECLVNFNTAFSISSSLISFYIPLLIMSIVYWQIYKTASFHHKQISKTNKITGSPSATEKLNAGARSPQSRKKQKRANAVKEHGKAAKTLGVIMGCFVACWLPFFVMNIVSPLCGDCVPAMISIIFTWLGYANSAVNPFLYGCLNKEFKHAFKDLLSGIRTCGGKYESHFRKTMGSSLDYAGGNNAVMSRL